MGRLGKAKRKCREFDMIVSINPVTKQPTCFPPAEGTAVILSGPYQNAAEVSEEWVAAERECVNRIMRAVAAEREECAKIAESVDSEMGTNQTQYVADLIRARGEK